MEAYFGEHGRGYDALELFWSLGHLGFQKHPVAVNELDGLGKQP